MFEIRLNDHEGQLLREILESVLSDLRMEIANTDSVDFKEGLKKREQLLKQVISALSVSSGASKQ